MPIKRYSSKEPVVFVWIITPYIVFMNLLIFGTCIFGSIGCFFRSFLTSAAYFFIIYAIFGSLAVIIKNRNPGAGDLFKRVRLMLPFFYLMNIGAVYGAFYIFRHVVNLGCVPMTGMVWWTILYGCIMSTVITFINDGMANWENWKNSLSESEKLKNAYQRSKLLGLKGQINPHFLFNCFNTLSGLIQENEEEAEKFLDEMGAFPVFGLFDFDRSYNEWNSLKGEDALIEADPFKGLTKKLKDRNSYAFLVPVPKIDEIKKQVIRKGNITYKENSKLEIEHLFYCAETEKHFHKAQVVGGGELTEISDAQKMTFASTIVPTLDDEYFKVLKPMFEFIKSKCPH
mgnify:CR=1 FL=1